MDKSSQPGMHGVGASYPPRSTFARHSRAVGVLWGVFSVCCCIIVIVVFIQPHWIGAPLDSAPGHMGLWRWCSTSSPEAPGDVICTGELQDIPFFRHAAISSHNIRHRNDLHRNRYDSVASSPAVIEETDGDDGPIAEPFKSNIDYSDSTILSISSSGGVDNTPFKASALLTAFSVLMMVLSVTSMLLFTCVRQSRVYMMAGWLQIIAGSLLGAAVCVYPLGFSSSEVRHLCGPTARQYNLGECNLRWAYVLAIIGVFDSIVLAALAMVLATRNIKYQDAYHHHADMYKGDFGHDAMAADGASLAASRKSLNLQPVMVQHDTYGSRHHYQL